MNVMKLTIAIMAVLSLSRLCQAEETLAEKTHVQEKTVERGVKKAAHRTEEAFCGKLTGDDKVQCLAKKAKHRIEESKDAVKDKASEVKNDIDSEKK